MLYRQILLILSMLLAAPLLFAQSNYSDYSEAQRTDFFYDDFNNNQHSWFVGYERKGKRNGSISDGNYVWTSKSQLYDEHASWKRIMIDQTRDFEIETRIKFVQGNPRESTTTLSWGRSEKGSFFFGFKEDEFYISRWHKFSGLAYYVKQRRTSYLNRNDYNTLTVRKTDNTYRFFINEKPVFSMEFRDFYGPNIGFESTNLIHVDYLRVSYLDGSNQSPLASKQHTETREEILPAQSESNPSTSLQQAAKVETASNEDTTETPSTDTQLAQQSDTPASSDKPSPTEEEVKTTSNPTVKDTATEVTTPANSGDRPIITITEPTLSRGFKQIAVQRIKIAGKATDRDGIEEVVINGKPAWLRPDGQFSLEAPLHLGDNEFIVVATDRQQQSTTSTFSVRRDEPTQERRLALVIGNSTYEQGGQLRNPINDANAMQSTLEGLGFTVMKYENCRQNDIKRAIDKFGRELQNYDVGLFFYAGHGVQVNGSNYLIPVDAQLASSHDVEYDCVRADRVLAKMEAANSRTNIVMLDACRDNPFERSWSRSTKGNGLAFMSAPRGSLVAYATAPGQTASDGGGEHGVYTEALLDHLATPNLTIEQVFKRVRATVSQKSDGKQIPWESTSLTGDFYFKK